MLSVASCYGRREKPSLDAIRQSLCDRTERPSLFGLGSMSQQLYHRVLRDGVRLLSRDRAATTTREGQALSRYCDCLPQLQKVDALHAARIAGGAFGR